MKMMKWANVDKKDGHKKTPMLKLIQE